MKMNEQKVTSNEESPLNDQQLIELKERLLTMKHHISLDSADSTNTNRHSDPLDQAQEATEHMMNLRNIAMRSDLLSEIEKAIYRMQIGEYGYCEISGDPIDSRRLMANPISRTCIEEQENLERRSNAAASSRWL